MEQREDSESSRIKIQASWDFSRRQAQHVNVVKVSLPVGNSSEKLNQDVFKEGGEIQKSGLFMFNNLWGRVD